MSICIERDYVNTSVLTLLNVQWIVVFFKSHAKCLWSTQSRMLPKPYNNADNFLTCHCKWTVIARVRRACTVWDKSSEWKRVLSGNAVLNKLTVTVSYIRKCKDSSFQALGADLPQHIGLLETVRDLWVYWWRSGRASDFRSSGRGFDSRPGRNQVTYM